MRKESKKAILDFDHLEPVPVSQCVRLCVLSRPLLPRCSGRPPSHCPAPSSCPRGEKKIQPRSLPASTSLSPSSHWTRLEFRANRRTTPLAGKFSARTLFDLVPIVPPVGAAVDLTPSLFDGISMTAKPQWKEQTRKVAHCMLMFKLLSAPRRNAFLSLRQQNNRSSGSDEGTRQNISGNVGHPLNYDPLPPPSPFFPVPSLPSFHRIRRIFSRLSPLKERAAMPVDRSPK